MNVNKGGYFIYLRKSRKDVELEAELGDTLARHKKLLLDLAKVKQYPVTKVYEEVVSGESIANRPQIQQMLSDIETDGCEGVLVMEVERLARGDSVDQGIISRTFSITGTKIITPTKTYDPTNEFDQEYFEFGLFMSRREYKTILRRIQQGRIASVNEGKYIGSVAPFGYERVKIEDAKGYTLKPIKPDCDTVRIIYDLYINGQNGEQYGSYKIAAYLQDHNYISRRGTTEWSPSSVRDILKNITYAGYIRWGYRKMEKTVKDGQVIRSKASTPSSDAIIVKGCHPALVSEDMFNAVQKRLKSSIVLSTSANRELKNPLAGIVYCRKCGRVMSRLGEHPHNKYSTLICTNRACNNVSSPIILVENEIIGFLKKWMSEQTVNVDSNIVVENNERIEVLKEKSNLYLKEMADIELQIENTYTLLEKGVYDTDTFTMRQKKLTDQQRDIKRHNVMIKREITKLQTKNDNISTYMPYMANLLESYNSCESAYDKNIILRELVDKVYYEKDTVNKKGKALEKNFALQIIPKIR